MFERYTEKTRRVIFFARYEASQYGSPTIETEHLLLGIMRERREALAAWFPGRKNVAAEIRNEIEKRTTRAERVLTSIELPLTLECRKILQLAAEAADRLGHREIRPEHFVIAILRVETCVAAQILSARGLKASMVEQTVGQESRPVSARVVVADSRASQTVNEFLEGLKSLAAGELVRFFAKDAQFIDASGKRWTREEIENDGEMLFALYAKKNATYVLEEILADTSSLLIATVLWKNALLASQERSWMHRMTVVFRERPDWKIVVVQVTPVQASLSAGE